MFVEILAKLTKEKGITIRKLALDLEIPTTSMHRYANGQNKPDIEIITKIAEYFGVTTDYLLGKSKDSNGNATSDSDIKFALFGNREIDDEVLDEVKELAKIIEQRHRDKNASS